MYLRILVGVVANKVLPKQYYQFLYKPSYRQNTLQQNGILMVYLFNGQEHA
jgi:hypothetical protein